MDEMLEVIQGVAELTLLAQDRLERGYSQLRSQDFDPVEGLAEYQSLIGIRKAS
jgi:hypothetical protein